MVKINKYIATFLFFVIGCVFGFLGIGVAIWNEAIRKKEDKLSSIMTDELSTLSAAVFVGSCVWVAVMIYIHNGGL